MRKFFWLVFVKLIVFSSFSQEDGNSKQLAFNQDFINWVSSVTNNEWDIQVDFRTQLKERLIAFKDALIKTQSNNEVNMVINNFKLDPEFSDQQMAEHLVYGFYVKQSNPAVWNLPPEERKVIIKEAYLQGMNSNDARWIKIKENLIGKVFQHCGSTARVTVSEIIGCFWETIEAAIPVASVTALATAINSGSWSASVAAIKKLLKTVARKFGWFGLAVAAIDVGICIWDANND